MCIMKSKYTLIKGNGSIMYIPRYEKHTTLIFVIIEIHLEVDISQKQ